MDKVYLCLLFLKINIMWSRPWLLILLKLSYNTMKEILFIRIARRLYLQVKLNKTFGW